MRRKVVQNAASLPHKNYVHVPQTHKIGYFFVLLLSPANSTSLGSLQRSPVPLTMRRRGEGASLSPLFILLGFRASEPPSTFCRVTLHKAVLCGVPKNNMTPNDIRAYQTTSFV